MPGRGEGIHTGRAYAPELREENWQQSVMRARKAIHVQGPKLAQNEFKHGPLKTEVVDLLDFREVIRQLILLLGNPLRDELNLVIMAEPKPTQADVLKMLGFEIASLEQKEDIQSVASSVYYIAGEELLDRGDKAKKAFQAHATWTSGLRGAQILPRNRAHGALFRRRLSGHPIRKHRHRSRAREAANARAKLDAQRTSPEIAARN